MSDKLGMAYAMKKYRAKKMADGGPVDPDSNMGKAFASIRGAFGGPKKPEPKPKGYADGGMASDNDWAKFTGAPVSEESGLKEGVGSALSGFSKGMSGGSNIMSAFNNFARMAHGGIAAAIRAKKMSEGGKVEDDFLSADMAPEPPSDLDYEFEEVPPSEPEESQAESRQGRLSKIMANLHSKHYGKK